jgi:hypothetical protein
LEVSASGNRYRDHADENDGGSAHQRCSLDLRPEALLRGSSGLEFGEQFVTTRRRRCFERRCYLGGVVV